MAARTDLFELEDTFRQVIRRAKACWNAIDVEGLSSTQALLLQKLEEEGPLKVSQLAEALLITAGAVTSFSDKLILGGYATRIRSEEDRRVVYLEITDKGRDVLNRVRTYRKQMLEQLFGKLPTEDVQHLTRIFRALLEEFEQRT